MAQELRCLTYVHRGCLSFSERMGLGLLHLVFPGERLGLTQHIPDEVAVEVLLADGLTGGIIPHLNVEWLARECPIHGESYRKHSCLLDRSINDLRGSDYSDGRRNGDMDIP